MLCQQHRLQCALWPAAAECKATSQLYHCGCCIHIKAIAAYTARQLLNTDIKAIAAPFPHLEDTRGLVEGEGQAIDQLQLCPIAQALAKG